MCPATCLDHGYSRNWTIGLCIDFKDISVLLAVQSLHYLLASDPRVRRTNTAGTVGGGATEDRKVSYHLIVVECLMIRGVGPRSLATYFQFRVPAARRLVVLKIARGHNLQFPCSLAVLMIANKNRIAATSTIRSHAVENSRRRLTITHDRSLHRNYLIIEIDRKPQVAFVYQWSVTFTLCNGRA